MTLLVLLGLAELDHGELVVELPLDAADRGELVLERGALLHHALRALLVVPESGVFGLSLFSSASRTRALSKSKMPPQQPDRLLDLLDDVSGFPRAWLTRRTNRWCRRDVATARCGRKPRPTSLATALDAFRTPAYGVQLEADAAPVDAEKAAAIRNRS